MKPLSVKTIARCNKLLSAQTPNPLVSLIRLTDTVDLLDIHQFEFYTVWLKEWNGCCPSAFGWKTCDFNDGALISLPPEKPIDQELWKCESCQPQGRLLCFHPSVFDPLKTSKHYSSYSFFKYRSSECLHLSQRERLALEHEMNGIEEELYWGIDEYSYTILADRIRLLLDYVSRFYHRQFILRHDTHLKIVDYTDRWLDNFFIAGKARYRELPTAGTFARQFDCSPDYFNDLLRHETGKDTTDYVKFKQIAIAENWLRQSNKSVKEVAETLGFPSGQAFCTLFKRLKGHAPEEITSRLKFKHIDLAN
ncbi:AraC family transcriptional regulator [Barnesiella sp. An55]|uniref:helix-turn-helix domain-containing protein n=1 Tax=Barnesiella sp. An55 TaxID=1965646 RepID=UPI000B39A108|nr:AraC family transcriptional regulator [Barnesiella sp. An55]OUN71534.1 hypothetical protein B5G10_08990 [Barnesiella sp. An55]HIZ26844.1 AraC family transcriptional regulator [Candidatus Barnesiella merdipullorum]